MPIHIPVSKDDNSEEISVRKAAAIRRRDAYLAKDPDHYKKLGKKGGKSGGRPFRDNPEAAKKAINKRWGKKS